MPPPEALALIGDAHLRDGDPEIGPFLRFLEALPGDVGTLAILGDLFAVWIGFPDMVRDHHARVIEALRRLRRRGCRLLYVEGNHDFYLRPLYAGDPFDEFGEAALDLTLHGRRLHLAHGDLVNARDRQYLAWRGLTKNRVFPALFARLPRRFRHRLADRLEGSLAATNAAFRRGFPFDECAAYARPRIDAGAEVIVLGHFHEERRLDYHEGGRRGTVFVLPAWRAGHRYLRIAPGADPAFVSA